MDKNKIVLLKSQLAEFLGVNAEDISQEDSFVDDLHMQATDLSDFMNSLSSKEFESDSVDLTQIETVNDLIEALELDDNT